MKVHELIQLLQQCPQDDYVTVDIDGEDESAELIDVAVGQGTLRGFTYLNVKPYR